MDLILLRQIRHLQVSHLRPYYRRQQRQVQARLRMSNLLRIQEKPAMLRIINRMENNHHHHLSILRSQRVSKHLMAAVTTITAIVIVVIITIITRMEAITEGTIMRVVTRTATRRTPTMIRTPSIDDVPRRIRIRLVVPLVKRVTMRIIDILGSTVKRKNTRSSSSPARIPKPRPPRVPIIPMERIRLRSSHLLLPDHPRNRQTITLVAAAAITITAKVGEFVTRTIVKGTTINRHRPKGTIEGTARIAEAATTTIAATAIEDTSTTKIDQEIVEDINSITTVTGTAVRIATRIVGITTITIDIHDRGHRRRTTIAAMVTSMSAVTTTVNQANSSRNHPIDSAVILLQITNLKFNSHSKILIPIHHRYVIWHL